MELTRIDIGPLDIQIHTKPFFQLDLHTLLRNRHEIRRSENITDLRENRVVRGQVGQIFEFHVHMAA